MPIWTKNKQTNNGRKQCLTSCRGKINHFQLFDENHDCISLTQVQGPVGGTGSWVKSIKHSTYTLFFITLTTKKRKKKKTKRHPIVFGFKARLRQAGGQGGAWVTLRLPVNSILYWATLLAVPSILRVLAPLSLFQTFSEFLCEAQVEQLHGGEWRKVGKGLEELLPA